MALTWATELASHHDSFRVSPPGAGGEPAGFSRRVPALSPRPLPAARRGCRGGGPGDARWRSRAAPPAGALLPLAPDQLPAARGRGPESQRAGGALRASGRAGAPCRGRWAAGARAGGRQARGRGRGRGRGGGSGGGTCERGGPARAGGARGGVGAGAGRAGGPASRARARWRAAGASHQLCKESGGAGGGRGERSKMAPTAVPPAAASAPLQSGRASRAPR